MEWHTLSAGPRIENTDAFEKEALAKTHLSISYVPPRYRSSYFSHIWTGNYAAGYYAYLWSEMLEMCIRDRASPARANWPEH